MKPRSVRYKPKRQPPLFARTQPAALAAFMPERADLHPGTKKRATSSFQFSRKGVHTGVEPRFERVGQGTRDHHVQDLQQAAESPSTCIGTSSGPRITSCSDSMRGPLPIKLLHCCTVFSPSCRALPTVGSGNRRLGRQGAYLPEVPVDNAHSLVYDTLILPGQSTPLHIHAGSAVYVAVEDSSGSLLEHATMLPVEETQVLILILPSISTHIGRCDLSLLSGLSS